MKKLPRWLIYLLIIIPLCIALALLVDHMVRGDIDVSDSAPSEAMMRHIAAHTEELLAHEELFMITPTFYDFRQISYIGNPDIDIACLIVPNPVSTENDIYTSFFQYPYSVESRYIRDMDPNFFYWRTPWSQLRVWVNVSAPGIWLYIDDFDAPAVSDAALREMLAAIERIIGTP